MSVSTLLTLVLAIGTHEAAKGTVLIYDVPGTHTFTPEFSTSVSFLMVGGGGGGGMGSDTGISGQPPFYGGGGGAGGFISGSVDVNEGVEYTIVVGHGGGINSAGTSSTFNGMTAVGGGMGCHSYSSASPGGSGGGGCQYNYQGLYSSAAGQGHSGGTYVTSNSGLGAGGGGATGPGQSRITGGTGIGSSITGVYVVYARGGYGAPNYVPVANTGSGGSGGRPAGVGNGGSDGIVVISFDSPTSVPTPTPSEKPTPHPSQSPSSYPSYNPTSSAPTGTPSEKPTPHPSQSPSSYPSYNPTSSAPTEAPSALPTSPTSSPSTVPSSIPSGSPSTAPTSPTSMPTMAPTLLCPLGTDMLAGSGPLAGTGCIPCKVGQYGDATGCHDCPSWRWTLETGSVHCDYYTAQNDVSIVFLISASCVYGLFSGACFIFYVLKTKNWFAVVTVVLITGDQVTDLLYTYYSTFSHPALMIASLCFCLLNLAAHGAFLLANFSMQYSLVAEWHKRSWAYFNSLEGDFKGVFAPYSGWVFHRFFRVSVTQVLPLLLIFLVADVIWVAVRVVLLFLITLAAIFCQLNLLPIGMIFYVTKLISTPEIFDFFWSLWNPNYLTSNRPADSDSTVFNYLVLAEVALESCPELCIQLLNNALLYSFSSWPVLTIISFSFSALMLLTVFNHFRYHYSRRNKNVVEGAAMPFRFADIPKFDILEQLAEALHISKHQKSDTKGEEEKSLEFTLEMK